MVIYVCASSDALHWLRVKVPAVGWRRRSGRVHDARYDLIPVNLVRVVQSSPSTVSTLTSSFS